ncbi:hypothetical protein AB3S75_025836 [Citrus x aurantiifolia]
METRFRGEAHHFYGMNSMDLRAVGKKTLEWDLNDWKWDGDLFIASKLNPAPNENLGRQFFPLAVGNSSNSSSSCSDEVNLGIENGKREVEKKRRAVVVEDHNSYEAAAGGLSLKLGGNGHPLHEREMGNWAGSSGKKTKFGGGSSSRAVCQVEDCGADLSNAKDYHRRHKVCEMHSKASRALVGNVMQRFCQQCSRFHVLQEFDEGKRSCRRRLAGHNKRRRKTNPDAAANGSSPNNDQTSGYLLISLLRILSNMHSSRSDQRTDQDLLSHLLRGLASPAGENGGRGISGLLQEHQDMLNERTSAGNSEVVQAFLANGQGCPTPFRQQLNATVSEMPQQVSLPHDARGAEDQDEDVERSPVPANLGTSSIDCPSWVRQDSQQSSPPQTSGNSDSASAQSPSSSSDAQSRTDRIVFKLFGKEPNDFPLVLRAQILDWLSHSPSDMESYIRPGCVILTIYLRQAEAAWEELCCDLTFSLSRLLDLSNDSFWTSGWVYARVQHQIAFIYNGQVVLDTSLPPRSNNYSKILSVKPIAVPASERAQFLVKGINLGRSATRLLCAVEGKYMVQEATHELLDDVDGFKELDELQCVNFSCSIPALTGRGFIEIEDHGFSSTFFPFLVAAEDVCSEIRMLESALEFNRTDADVERFGKIDTKNQAMDFIHEIGWLFHRSQSKSRLGHLDPNTDLFPLRRFKWLIEFSMDHEWCAVVKKLLHILLDGTVSLGEHPSLDLALTELGLLHRAVRKNSRPLVDLLLRFVPLEVSDRLGSENKALVDGVHKGFLFRPDAIGPAGLTPIHIAAGKDGSEDVLDALTDDPGMVGIEAWKNARDSSGSTPEDYARLRGHYSYIHLVQKKINKRPNGGHVVVDICGVVPDSNIYQKQNNESTACFEIGQTAVRPTQHNCKLCHQKLGYATTSRSLVYRPAMLSMVAIAAVCVCVALLFKSCPEVLYVFRPFRWEMLDYGTS